MYVFMYYVYLYKFFLAPFTLGEMRSRFLTPVRAKDMAYVEETVQDLLIEVKKGISLTSFTINKERFDNLYACKDLVSEMEQCEVNRDRKKILQWLRRETVYIHIYIYIYISTLIIRLRLLVKITVTIPLIFFFFRKSFLKISCEYRIKIRKTHWKRFI